MRSFAKQRGARVLAFWAVAFCLALSAVQVSAAPSDFLRSFYAGDSTQNGLAGELTPVNGRVYDPITIVSSAAHPISGQLYFFDDSGVIARVFQETFQILSGITGNKVAYSFSGATPVSPISSLTFSNVFSLAFDGTGKLYAVDVTSDNVIQLDFALDQATVVANIPNAYSVVPNSAGTALYYTLDQNDNNVYKVNLVPGSVVQTSAGVSVGSGNFQIFIVTSDESKIYGSVFSDKQFYELTLSDKSVKTFGDAAGTITPASPQVDVTGVNAVTGGFSAVAFYKSNTQLIISSDAGYVFFYDVTADKFSRIAGNGVAFNPATDVNYNGRALQTATSPYSVTVSPTGKIYVDFQTSIGSDYYSFFEALDTSLVSIDLTPTSVNEGSAATFTISRATTTDQPLTVNLARNVASTAIAADFTSTPAFTGNSVAVTILANAASATLVVTTATDALAESPETLIVDIVADAAYNIDSVDNSKTLTINDVPSGPAPGTGTIEGDPHFVGFEGQFFDFPGHPGKIYNLISDPDLQVNSLFGIQQNTPKTYSGGPILENIAIFTSGETVVIQSGGSNTGTAYSILYNNAAVAEGSQLGTNLKVSFTKVNKLATEYGFSDSDRVFAVVSVDYISAYKFLIYIIENGRSAAGVFTQAYAHRFLDVNAQIIDTARNPEGVLGETFSPSPNTKRDVETRGLTPAFQLKGKVSDYEVKDGIYGTAFTYNQYDPAPAPAGPPAPAGVDPA